MISATEWALILAAAAFVIGGLIGCKAKWFDRLMHDINDWLERNTK
jgi:hypothetical protein